MKTNRREFIRNAGVITACACAGLAGINGCSIIGGISGTPEINSDAWKMEDDNLVVDLQKTDSLKKTGGAGKLNIGGRTDGYEKKIIVIHHQEGEYKAFADCCTHGNRELNYLHEEGQLECSSFGKSVFSLQGLAIKGPAENPLRVFPLLHINNTIVIDLST